MLEGTMQKQNFQDRLNRVAKGGANTRSQVYAGTTEPERKQRRSKRKAKAEPEIKAPRSKVGAPVSLILGLLIGIAAVGLTRYLRFYLTGDAIGGANADITLMLEAAVAVSIAIMARTVIRIYSKLHGLAKLVGVAAAILLMHNAVHMAPTLFAQVFSPQWVSQVTAQTNPNTVLMVGPNFGFKPAVVSLRPHGIL